LIEEHENERLYRTGVGSGVGSRSGSCSEEHS